MSLARRALAMGAILLALTLSQAARAETVPLEEAFRLASTALDRGEYGAALDGLESLADRGFVHPDASYDRGLAYLQRVRAKAEIPGDLGRAAAGFEEALRLRPSDSEAEAALDRVRAEVTRRRSRRAKDVVDARPTLDRLVVGLASERTWKLAAITASVLFAVGLVLRRRPSGAAHVAGSVLAPTAFIALLVTTPLAHVARTLREETRAGVIVVPEVFLTREDGVAIGGDAIPEAALVEVSKGRGGQAHLRWGTTEGWAPSSAIRVLAEP